MLSLPGWPAHLSILPAACCLLSREVLRKERQQQPHGLTELFVCSLDERPGRGGGGRVSEPSVQAQFMWDFPESAADTAVPGWTWGRQAGAEVYAARAASPQGAETGQRGGSRQIGKNFKRSPTAVAEILPSPKHPAPAPAPLASPRLEAVVLLGPGVSASSPKDRQWKN